MTKSVSLATTQLISNTPDVKLYQTARAGMSSYKFAVPNGVYILRFRAGEDEQLLRVTVKR